MKIKHFCVKADKFVHDYLHNNNVCGDCIGRNLGK